MNKNEMQELDAWIAELMEPKPASMALKHVRKANDHLYNVAEAHSKEHWWKCQTGSDAEGENGEHTYCAWVPNYEPCSDPDETSSKAVAMDVLKKCIEFGGIKIKKAADDKRFVVRSDLNWEVFAIGDTLELAICLFAKRRFIKQKT